MVLTDLSKAFDSLCHSTQNLGTSNKALLWIESYLTNRQQFTRVATSLSEPLTITHGVPQGSIQGPTLFSLFMNDPPEVIKFSNIESYVDDTKIYFSFASKGIDSCLRQVDEGLEHVSEWCCKKKNCKLHVYPRSTLEFIWTRLNVSVRSRSNWIFFLMFFFLYTWFEPDLPDHIASLTSSFLSKSAQINMVRHFFFKDVLYIILNSLVFSKLFYCSTAWYETSKENIHKLQLM